MLFKIFKDTLRKEKNYDLDNKQDCSSLKTKITKALNEENLEVLNEVSKSIENSENKEKLEKVLGDRVKKIKAKIAAIKKRGKIEIKVNGNTYNIREKKREKALLTQAQKFARNKDFDKLKNIIEELEKVLEAHAISRVCRSLIAKINILILKKEQDNNYQQYTLTTKPYFLTNTSSVRAVDRKKTAREIARKKYACSNSSALEAYLTKPVAKKKKTGEQNFQHLSLYVLLDLFKNQDFSTDVKKAEEFKYLFVASALSTFSHAASIYPAQGYGRSKKDEVVSPGRYFRSEADHPLLKLVKEESKQHKKEDESSSCYGAQNMAVLSGVISMLNTNSRGKSKQSQLEKVQANGRPKKGTVATGLGPLLSHAGGRCGILAQYMMLLREHGAIDKKSIMERLMRVNIPERSMGPKGLRDGIKELKAEFSATNQLAPVRMLEKTENLPEKFAAFRTKQASAITEACGNLEKIDVEQLDSASCCVLTLYPDCKDQLVRNDRNNAEGLTNVLVGFLGGLINYNAQQKGLNALVQRRQSFGFLRATIADREGLQIRLSLGLESDSFTQVMIDSIKQLNTLLIEYNLLAKKSKADKKTNHDETANEKLISNLHKPCEEAKGESQGNYLLNSMRVIDDRVMALLVAQKMLEDSSGENPKEAFERYLKEFILKRVDEKAVTTEKKRDHTSISRDGFAILAKNPDEVLLTKKLTAPQEKKLLGNNMPLLLMQNMIKTVVDYIVALKDIPSSYTCYHLLVKLLHACQKGMALLGGLARYEESHLSAKANLNIESLFEYFSLFKLMVEKGGAKDNFVENEKKYFQETLLNTAYLKKCYGENPELKMSYHDSGQQAIVGGLYALYTEFKSPELKSKTKIYLSTNSYYEVKKHCEDISIATSESLADSTLAFIDVTTFSSFQDHIEVLVKAKKACSKIALKAVIIDITHNSTKKMLNNLRTLIEKLHRIGITVLLSCSCLKHEEAGQDRFPLGRNILLTPNNQALKTDSLKSADGAMNPMVASFQSTVRSCFNESTLFSTPNLPVEIAGLSQPGVAAS